MTSNSRLEVPVYTDESDTKGLLALRSPNKEFGLALSCGCFDLCHIGHLHFLEEYLDSIVHREELISTGHWKIDMLLAVNSDESFRSVKGRAPIYTFEHRVTLLNALAPVQAHLRFIKMNSVEPSGLIRTLRPEYYVKGEEYSNIKNAIEWPALEEVGSTFTAVSSLPFHTSYYINRIKNLGE